MEQEIQALELPEWEILPDIGLYMDQVVTLMDRTFSPTLPKGEMTKSMVNNYVKVGMIPRPTGKKYDRDHLAMLIMIGVLKQALSMESISRLLEVICRDGIQEGYDRFRMMTESIDPSRQKSDGLSFRAAANPQGSRLCVQASWRHCVRYAHAACWKRTRE